MGCEGTCGVCVGKCVGVGGGGSEGKCVGVRCGGKCVGVRCGGMCVGVGRVWGWMNVTYLWSPGG